MEKNAKNQIVSSITKYLSEENERTKMYDKYKEFWDNTHCVEGCLLVNTLTENGVCQWKAACAKCGKLVCARHYRTFKDWCYTSKYLCPKCFDE